jgi:hypothetical protein
LNPPIARSDLGGRHELDMLKPGSTYLLRIMSDQTVH